MRLPSPSMFFKTGAVLAVGLIAFGCGSDDGDDASATVLIDGSSTVFPVSQAVAEAFHDENDSIDVSVGTSGTGGGFEKFCRGETDISDASRPIKDDEVAACADEDIQFVELIVATDGLSVVVNPENDYATCLTVDQLNKIWMPDSTVTNWNDIDPSWPDEKIGLYGPGTDSGTFDYFTDVINGEEGASRTDYTPSEDDNVLVQGVAGDEYALAYFGYGYVAENEGVVKAIGVDGGSGCVEPNDETVTGGTYAPLSRPLYIYVSTAAIERDEVVDFIDFYLDEVQTLATDVGYSQLTDEQLAEQKAAWTTFTTA